MIKQFSLNNKLVLINSDDLLQQNHCVEAVIEAGGKPILICPNKQMLINCANKIEEKYLKNIFTFQIEPMNEQNIILLKNKIYSKFQIYPDIIINSLDTDFNYGDEDDNSNIELNEEKIKKWNRIVHEKLTSILLLTKNFGHQMSKGNGGVILNILSDRYLNPKINNFNSSISINHTALIAVANGIHGFTKYIATYWNKHNIRSNSLTIGTYKNSPKSFPKSNNLKKQIPIGRFANDDEFKAAIVFLISDASSYMTGSNLTINGGRTCW